MAYRSLNQRFPKLKWVLLLAVLITLPLTVFSVQKVSTSTEQHAAVEAATTTTTCAQLGGGCFYGQCSNGYFQVQGTSSSICNPNGNYVCCTNKLSKPTGLKAYSSYCKRSGTEYDTINFNWSHVRNATSYTLYYRVYASGTSYTAVNISGYYNTAYLLTRYKNLNGRHIQWYIKASNGYTSSTSDILTTPTAIASCP